MTLKNQTIGLFCLTFLLFLFLWWENNWKIVGYPIEFYIPYWARLIRLIKLIFSHWKPSIIMLLKIVNIGIIFSALSFLFFGTGCLTSKYLISEFVRYGIPQFRVLTGVLQLLGALGLLFGFFNNYLQIISAAGLSLLMLCGVITRILINDTIFQTLPAFFYCILNAFLFLQLVNFTKTA